MREDCSIARVHQAITLADAGSARPPFPQLDSFFLKLNPKGEVPVLVHGDKVTTGTVNIVKYIDDKFEGPKLKLSDARVEKFIALHEAIDVNKLISGFYVKHNAGGRETNRNIPKWDHFCGPNCRSRCAAGRCRSDEQTCMHRGTHHCVYRTSRSRHPTLHFPVPGSQPRRPERTKAAVCLASGARRRDSVALPSTHAAPTAPSAVGKVVVPKDIEHGIRKLKALVVRAPPLQPPRRRLPRRRHTTPRARSPPTPPIIPTHHRPGGGEGWRHQGRRGGEAQGVRGAQEAVRGEQRRAVRGPAQEGARARQIRRCGA